jgi:type VI secretion system FHA domain protein
MILTLEVIGEQAEDLGAASRKVFNGIGGTIGRLPDNDWVFPDPYVSGRHALIRYLNGKYFIEDTSTNGVFINTPDNRLSRTQAQQLRNGDVIFIDAYRIRVSIENDPEAPDRKDPFAGLRPQAKATPRRAPEPPPGEDRTASMALRDPDDDGESGEHGTQWFGSSEMSPAKPPAPAARGRAESPRSGPSSRPPAPPREVPPPSRSKPPAARAGSSGSSDDVHLQTLLDAAGIEGLEPSAEAAQALGEILRTAVGGLMEVLRARERMKDELRMRGTTFKAAHNNPLKFSANVDDAFHNLLVKRNPAYLDAGAAFEDAFRDVRDHQAAFLAAMRIAFESMLAEFDPTGLQEDFERAGKGSILGVPAKLKYWDLYRDRYAELAKDAEAGFRTLFADEFAKAYEEQLERLKAQGRQREGHPRDK